MFFPTQVPQTGVYTLKHNFFFNSYFVKSDINFAFHFTAHLCLFCPPHIAMLVYLSWSQWLQHPGPLPTTKPCTLTCGPRGQVASFESKF